jgi:uncharacterized protein YlxW (UPF0749 family)
MSETSQDDNTIKVRIPATLTLRDIVTFVALAVSITLAWGVFGTRLTVVESQLVAMTKTDDDIKNQLKDMNQHIIQLENRIRDNEATAEDMWRYVRKTK